VIQGGNRRVVCQVYLAEVRAELAPGTPVEAWFQDEMRVGQKDKLTYRWARKGSRPRASHDQRTQSTYLFGAVCPQRPRTAGLQHRGHAASSRRVGCTAQTLLGWLKKPSGEKGEGVRLRSPRA
jgi:hypothetical protein